MLQSDLRAHGSEIIAAASRSTVPSPVAGWSIVLHTTLIGALMLVVVVVQTPKDALSDVFRGVVAPVGAGTFWLLTSPSPAMEIA